MSFALHDPTGKLVAEADGLVRRARQAQPGVRFPRGSPGSAPIPPDETLFWNADLLAYIDPPAPGRYLISATLRAGTEAATSPPVSLEVAENHATWLDVLFDCALIDVLYVLQQLPAGSEPQALFQLNSGARPENYWIGGTLDVPAGARPMVAEVDFTVSDTWDHAIERRVAWREGDQLRATRFHMDQQIGGVLTATLDPQSLGVLPAGAAPISVSRDWLGQTCLAAATGGAPPVSLLVTGPDGAARWVEILSAAELQDHAPGAAPRRAASTSSACGSISKSTAVVVRPCSSWRS